MGTGNHEDTQLGKLAHLKQNKPCQAHRGASAAAEPGRYLCTFRVWLFALLLVGLAVADDSPTPRPRRLAFGQGRKIATLANRDIRESSGLAASRRREGAFWTHNDSGGGAVLYALDKTGRQLRRVQVSGASARDWEDIASFEHDGKAYLLIADTGDNDRKRSNVALHLLAEPDLAPTSQPASRPTPRPARPRSTQLLRTVRVTYPDGAHDCEALAVDPHTDTVLLITKSPHIAAFRIPLKSLLGPEAPGKPLQAKRLAGLPILLPTAADITPDGRQLVVVNYWRGYLYERRPNEAWADALQRLPRPVALPTRRQGESVCFGPGGRDLYLTSEKLPTPLFRVPAD